MQNYNEPKTNLSNQTTTLIDEDFLSKIATELRGIFLDNNVNYICYLCKILKDDIKDIVILDRLLNFIKDNFNDNNIYIFINFCMFYYTIFTIQELLEIIILIKENDINFSIINNLNSSEEIILINKLLITIYEKTKDKSQQYKSDFINLIFKKEDEKIYYLMTRLNLYKPEACHLYYKVEFMARIFVLQTKNAFSMYALGYIETLYHKDIRTSVSLFKESYSVFEDFSQSDLIINMRDMENIDESFTILSELIINYWIDPTVAKNMILILNNLSLYINSYWSADELLNPNYTFSCYSIENKQALLSMWFDSPKILNLWQQMNDKIFSYDKYNHLLLICHNNYISSDLMDSDIIRQDIYDFLQSLILQQMLEKVKTMIDLIDKIPNDIESLYLFISDFKKYNYTNVLKIFYMLPNNVTVMKFIYNKSKNIYINDIIYDVIEKIQSLIYLDNNIDDLYNIMFIKDHYSLAIKRFISYLEKINSPIAYLTCGILLINGGDRNPEKLEGIEFDRYNEKRLHDAITFLNKSAVDPELYIAVRKLKSKIVKQENVTSVNIRLNREFNPKINHNNFFFKFKNLDNNQGEVEYLSKNTNKLSK